MPGDRGWNAVAVSRSAVAPDMGQPLPSPSGTTWYRATIEYDGHKFRGSQRQPGVRTVQGDVEGTLRKLQSGPTTVHFAGRTDSGVHATSQEISFATSPRWDVDEIGRALGATLPEDVSVKRVSEVDNDFHPRFDATARRYHYVILVGGPRRPLLRRLCWQVDESVDDAILGNLATQLPGVSSFASFARRGAALDNPLCRIESARWRALESQDRISGRLVSFEIVGNRFLQRMVRYLVGTSVEAAAGRRPITDFEVLLSGGQAARAAFPAPPQGLFLTGVRYSDGWNSPRPDLPCFKAVE